MTDLPKRPTSPPDAPASIYSDVYQRALTDDYFLLYLHQWLREEIDLEEVLKLYAAGNTLALGQLYERNIRLAREAWADEVIDMENEDHPEFPLSAFLLKQAE